MISVMIEVRAEAADFDVTTRAESIRQALSIVVAQYPGAKAKVRFPIDPEGFFVRDPGARAGLVVFDQPEPIAA
jgi:hypothetical protein